MLLRNALRGLFQIYSMCSLFYAADLSGQFNVSEGRELFVIFVIFLCRFLLPHLLAQWQESLHLMLIYHVH